MIARHSLASAIRAHLRRRIGRPTQSAGRVSNLAWLNPDAKSEPPRRTITP
jgi:hypothetical protein